jgi:predicted TIM-barrel fold metal-dependent hydrolase
MNAEETRRVYADLGISKICGSVISYYKDENDTMWEKLRRNNDSALALRDLYGDFYIPGFHIHPDYIDESIAEIRKMDALGIKLIGELVPAYHEWENYASDAMSILLDEAEKHDMIVNVHTQGNDQMDDMVKRHPNLIIIGAHPGEIDQMKRRHCSRPCYAEFSANDQGKQRTGHPVTSNKEKAERT